jgi:murein L,D-transpeptidase YafK
MGVPMKALGLAASCALWMLAATPLLVPDFDLSPSPANAHHVVPDTSEAGAVDLRLAAKGIPPGHPLMIRIFKAESELELWAKKGVRFELAAVYPICNWSGSLGPKKTEGDRQSPEGFYSVGPSQLHTKGRWPRSLDIGYPNTFDRAQDRSGSYILVHGGCTTTGCYAMTNAQMEEIYTLSEAALQGGQDRIPVHVFPFRMTEANLAARKDSEWSAFWATLKPGYDLFERTRIPPRISVCEKQYVATQEDTVLPDGCEDNVSRVQPTVRPVQKIARHARRLRRVASRTRGRRVASRAAARRAQAARKARNKRIVAQKHRHASASARRYD